VKNVCLNNTASARVHNIKIFLVNKEAYKWQNNDAKYKKIT
jgi:hypothetical protein